MRTLLLAGAVPALLIAAPAAAVTVTDATGDFLPTFTAFAGATPPADLDVTSFSVDYDAASNQFLLGATFAGEFDYSQPGLYVIGVNTGTGTIRPFAALGQENVIFNQAIVLNKNGTGNIGATQLDPADITFVGNILTARVDAALLPTTGFTFEQYGFNLWPRTGTGNNNQISDFSPENATLSVAGGVPEPSAWALAVSGVGLVGGALRGRRRPRVAFG